MRGPSKVLASIWASGPADVWVGAQNDGVMHFDGTHWTVPTLHSPLTQPASLTGTGPNDVWLLGALSTKGSVLGHFDGTSWNVAPASAIANVWAASPAELWGNAEGVDNGSEGISGTLRRRVP